MMIIFIIVVVVIVVLLVADFRLIIIRFVVVVIVLLLFTSSCMHEEDRRMKNAERDDADLSRCWPLSCASDVGAQPAILRPTPCTRCFSAKDGIDIGGRQSYGHPGQRLCGPVVPAGDVHVREAPDHQHLKERGRPKSDWSRHERAHYPCAWGQSAAKIWVQEKQKRRRIPKVPTRFSYPTS